MGYPTLFTGASLSLGATVDLRPLKSALEAAWFVEVEIDEPIGKRWYVYADSPEPHGGPEATVASMLRSFEGLPSEERSLCDACYRREVIM